MNQNKVYQLKIKRKNNRTQYKKEARWRLLFLKRKFIPYNYQEPLKNKGSFLKIIKGRRLFQKGGSMSYEKRLGRRSENKAINFTSREEKLLRNFFSFNPQREQDCLEMIEILNKELSWVKHDAKKGKIKDADDNLKKWYQRAELTLKMLMEKFPN